MEGQQSITKNSMEVKAFEIRDKATFIPVVAVRLESAFDAELYLMARAGYRGTAYTLLTRLSDLKTEYDANVWGGRTMPIAHSHIHILFHELESGSVIDVEFILNETQKPKKSERFYDDSSIEA